MANIFEITVKKNPSFSTLSVTGIGATIGKKAQEAIWKNFDVGGRPTKWKKSKGAKKRTSGNLKGKTLQASGRLKAAVRYRVTSDGVELTNNMSYARIHNDGGVIKNPGGQPYIVMKKKGKVRAVFMKRDGSYPEGVKFTKPHSITMPKREFMVLPDNFNDTVDDIIKSHFNWIEAK